MYEPESSAGRIVVRTDSEPETMELGSCLAGTLEAGDLVALIGDLGAGKTVFVKGVAKGLGVAEYLYVNSPSFVILKEYRGRIDLYHFDVYRLDPRAFADTLDYDRYFYGEGVAVVEWADRVADLLPEDRIEVSIEHEGENSRKFTITGTGRIMERVSGGLRSRAGKGGV